MKRSILFFVLFLLTAAFVLGAVACTPTTHEMLIDYTVSEGEIMHGATGWLYGIAEPDVPDGDLLKTLAPAVAAVKAPDGTQHPIGDVMNVAETFLSGGGQFLFVYMQDIYPEWYYVYRGIDDYREKVIEMTQKLAQTEYIDKVIFCPFNETDNGEWYGEFKKGASRQKFYSDWLDIFSTIRGIIPDAKIAGPGYMRYDSDYIEEFYRFCKDNDCLPDMAVWHELSDKSYYRFEKNYEDYREIERRCGVAELPVCISEYGEMSDNGVPGTMLQYISMYESKKVYACIAYWRLANNLSELAADATTPTAAWWLYYWYGNMRGDTYSVTNGDEKGSHFRAVTSFDEESKEATILAGGGDGTAVIDLVGISALPGMGGVDRLYVTVESVDFNGLGAECLAPTKRDKFALDVTDGSARITLDGAREDRCFKIVLSLAEDEGFVTDKAAVRYEAEDAELNGFSLLERWRASDDSSAYAVSGELIKDVKGADRSLDFSVSVPDDGHYDIRVCYASGYSPDGTPDSRTFSRGKLIVDGADGTSIEYPNTLSNTTTGAVTVESIYFEKGSHTVSLNCEQGEVYFDFIDVMLSRAADVLHSYPASDGILFVIAPEPGYYAIGLEGGVLFNGQAVLDGDSVYLQKGVNLFYGDLTTELSATACQGDAVEIDVCVQGDFSDAKRVSGESNRVVIRANVQESGLYAVSLDYSNNAQFGDHDYNVELVERYACVTVNDRDLGNVFFRNTCSWDAYAPKTLYIRLERGENEICLFNDKSYSPDGEASYLPLIDLDSVEVCRMMG